MFLTFTVYGIVSCLNISFMSQGQLRLIPVRHIVEQFSTDFDEICLEEFLV